MVGFNRRFAPLLLDLQQQLTRLIGPKSFIYTCNAGAIPADHWTQDPPSVAVACSVRPATSSTCFATWPPAPSKNCNWLALSIASPAQTPSPCSCASRMAQSAPCTTSLMAARPSPRSAWKCLPLAKCFVSTTFESSAAWGILASELDVSFRKIKGKWSAVMPF